MANTDPISYLTKEQGDYNVLQFVADNGLTSLAPDWTNDNAYSYSIQASSLVDSFEPRFTGARNMSTQRLAWPRQYAFLNASSSAQGSVSQFNATRIPSDEVPHLVRLATAHLTIRLAKGEDPFGDFYGESNEEAGRVLVEETLLSGLSTQRWQVTPSATRTARGFDVKMLLAPLLRNNYMTVSR